MFNLGCVLGRWTFTGMLQLNVLRSFNKCQICQVTLRASLEIVFVSRLRDVTTKLISSSNVVTLPSKLHGVAWNKAVLLTHLLTYLFTLLTYLLTPWSTVLFEKLTGSQLVKKFPAFYKTRRFITAFTSARHLSLSWVRSIPSMPAHPTFWRSILILSFHLGLDLPTRLFPLRFPPPQLDTPILCPTCYMPRLFRSRFDHPNNIYWGVQITKFLFL